MYCKFLADYAVDKKYGVYSPLKELIRGIISLHSEKPNEINEAIEKAYKGGAREASVSKFINGKEYKYKAIFCKYAFWDPKANVFIPVRSLPRWKCPNREDLLKDEDFLERSESKNKKTSRAKPKINL